VIPQSVIAPLKQITSCLRHLASLKKHSSGNLGRTTAPFNNNL